MKRIILALLIALLPSVSQAQLKIKSKTEAAETICSYRTGYEKLLYSEDLGYYLCLGSTNRYDKPLLFPLGEDKESAVATLKDLLSLPEAIGNEDMITVEGFVGEQVRISVEELLGIKGINFKGEGMAGTGGITPSNLKKMINKLSE